MSRQSRYVPVLCVLAVIGCGGGKPQESHEPVEAPMQLAQAPQETSAAKGGSAKIIGAVKFSGSAPAQEKVKMDADPQCLLQHKTAVHKEEVVVNDNGTLRNVFVYVKEGAQPGTAPTEPAMLDQQGCMYKPHVMGVQVNQPVQIVNSDQTLHNVNCKPTKSKPFNLAQPTKGMKTTKTFTAPEIMVRCACNVHPWMSMYIGVVEHPYFSVSGEDGGFSIANLPAGQYTVEAWHEKYGTKTQAINVQDGQTATLDFEFAAK